MPQEPHSWLLGANILQRLASHPKHPADPGVFRAWNGVIFPNQNDVQQAYK